MSNTFTFTLDVFNDVLPNPVELADFLDDIKVELDPNILINPANMAPIWETVTQMPKHDLDLLIDGVDQSEMSYVVMYMSPLEASLSDDNDGAGGKIPDTAVALPTGPPGYYILFATNDWSFPYHEPSYIPDDPANDYPEGYNGFLLAIAPYGFDIGGGWFSNGDFHNTLTITLHKNSPEPSPTPKPVEPAAYPSIERSLDKIVDKMEGNTVLVPGECVNYDCMFEYSFINGTFAAQTTYQGWGDPDSENVVLAPPLTADKVTMQIVKNNVVLSEIKLRKDDTSKLAPVLNGVMYVSDGFYDVIRTGVVYILDKTPGIMDAGLVMGEDDSFFDVLPETPGGYEESDCILRFVEGGADKNVPAYEVFKEAVPSIERSMWKIADLFEVTKNDESDKKDDTPSGTVYDQKNVNRYNVIIGNDGDVAYYVFDTLRTSNIPLSTLYDQIKASPLCVKTYISDVVVHRYKITPQALPVQHAYVDEQFHEIHLVLLPTVYNNGGISSMYPPGMPSTDYQSCLIFGEIILYEDFTRDFSNVYAILQPKNNGAPIISGGNNSYIHDGSSSSI